MSVRIQWAQSGKTITQRSSCIVERTGNVSILKNKGGAHDPSFVQLDHFINEFIDGDGW